MEMLENHMVTPIPKRRTWQELEEYEQHLLEEQDQIYQDKVEEELLNE